MTRASAGETVKVRASVVCGSAVATWAPWHARLTAPGSRVTGSEKVTARSAPVATSVAPSAGDVVVTDGAASTVVKVMLTGA